MPEGPECRVIAEGLDAILGGNILQDMEVLSGRYKTHGLPDGWDRMQDCIPQLCEEVGVKGKFIYIRLEGGCSIWSTLGMSGTWGKTLREHSRLALEWDWYADADRRKHGPAPKLYFTDPRNFGTIKFSFDRKELEAKLASLGLDLLNDDVSLEQTQAMFQKKKNAKKTLAEVLMDQSSFAGVGNYIKAEALYRARLSPHRTASSLDDGDIGRLHDAVLEVTRGAYAARGMSMSDYVDVDGNVGKFVRVVYGKSKDPDGRKVITEETKDGRTTHWVPEVQR